MTKLSTEIPAVSNSDLWVKIKNISLPVTEGVFTDGQTPMFDKDYVLMIVVSLKDITNRHDGRQTLVMAPSGDYQLVPK